MKYYLIDYENVNASGLDGIDKLSQDSRVVLFYTRNSNKIDLNMLHVLLHMDTALTVIEVHHGKQALDIQLASYVGYLIGTESEDSVYNIISKDKGYRNIQDFWSDRAINLFSSIRQAVRQKEAEEGQAAENAGKGGKSSDSSGESGSGKGSKSKGRSKRSESSDSSKGKTGDPADNAGGKAAEDDYQQRPSERRNEVNTEIQKILSKAGYPGDLINGAASFVSRNIDKDGYKQTIYRGIIKELGQKQGLEVYRLIKDIL